ncbi:MAG TPA: caspase family protein, partial [Vicinamibacteria bacterium]
MHRPRALASVLLASSFFVGGHDAAGAGAPPSSSPRKRALLVGIDQYRQVTDLQGCVNDVRRMKDVLTRRFGFSEADVTVVTDDQATRAGIIAALQARSAAAEPGDIVVFHYSGHGANMRDVSGDELDGRDETIVPHDSREPGVFDISDDELNGLLRELTRKTQNVTVVLDSCHSGSATRGGATVRRAPDDPRDPPPAAPFAWSPRGITEGPDDLRTRDSRYVLITGCKPHQLSNEFEADGRRFGALTYHLARALDRALPGSTYRDVMDLVAGEVRTVFPSQEPDLEGARADAPLFSGAEPASATYVLVSPVAQGRVEIAAGAAYGLAAGAVVDVYAPDTRDFTGAPAARVRLARVEAFRSEADVMEGDVAPLSRGVLRELSYAEPKLRLCYLGVGASPALQRIKAELDAYAVVQAVTDERDCDLRLSERDGQLVTETGDLAPRGAPVPAAAGDAVSRIRARVLGWSRWYAVLRLANPSPGVDVRVRLGDPPVTARAFAPGDQVDVFAENRSDRDLYLNLIDLSSDGSVEVLYPPAGASELLPARTTGKLTRLQFFVPEGEQAVTDTLKLFATTVPLDPRLFRQGAVRSGEAASASADPLAGLLDAAFLGKSRNARPVNLGGWTTAQETVVVSRDATPVVSAPAPPPGTPAGVPPGD